MSDQSLTAAAASPGEVEGFVGDRRNEWAGLSALKQATDLSSCLVPLLEALGWHGHPRHVAESLPHFIDELDLTGFRNVMAQLHYSSRPVRLKLRDPNEAPEVTQQLAGTLSGNLLILDWTQQNRTWFSAVQLEKRMMFIILTLIVAVAAFNLVSTLVMTVQDKRADIAILRTLGASPASIMKTFVVQGALVGVIGTLGGLALGLLIAFNIDVIVPFLERLFHASFLPKDVYLISRMPSDPQAGDIVPIAVISLLLSFVATIYPSWRASRVNPAEALRYE